MALYHVMQFEEEQEINKEYKLTDFKVEELGDLPVPHKDRFWMERRDDGVYVVIDDERRMAATFIFGQYYSTCGLTGYRGEPLSHSVEKTDFLLEVEIWLLAYFPAMVGSKPGEDEEDN